MYTIAKWFVELYTTDDVSLMDYEPPSPPKMTEELIEEMNKAEDGKKGLGRILQQS